MRKIILKHKLAKGSTILEILAAICVLSFGLLAIFSLFILSVRTTRKSHNFTVAYQTMNQTMEDMRSKPFNSLVAPSTSTNPVSGLPQGSLIQTIAVYNGDPNIKMVTLQVQWTEQNGQHTIHETTLTTLGGIND